MQNQGVCLRTGPLLALKVPSERYEYLLRARMGLWTEEQRELSLSGRSPHTVAREMRIPKSYIYRSDLWCDLGRRARET